MQLNINRTLEGSRMIIQSVIILTLVVIGSSALYNSTEDEKENLLLRMGSYLEYTLMEIRPPLLLIEIDLHRKLPIENMYEPHKPRIDSEKQILISMLQTLKIKNFNEKDIVFVQLTNVVNDLNHLENFPKFTPEEATASLDKLFDSIIRLSTTIEKANKF
uniref:Uncharacterized protein n=2 Tax=Clastoptera arizonana TaxID=38151 RepID=A0A1B6D5R0_9HEMI